MIASVYGSVGEKVSLCGYAYDFDHRIVAIEFSLDEGLHWTSYPTPDTNDYQNITWSFEYTPQTPGVYLLRIRSVNDEGRRSPESACAELHIG